MLENSNTNRGPIGETGRLTTRNWLAWIITLTSIVGTIILGIVVIVQASDDNGGQLVLNAVLPLIGTWVGTVLAFFFSRENFESANRSVERLTRQLSTQEQTLQQIPVKFAMVARSEMVICDTPDVTTLVTILQDLENKNFRQLPILDKLGIAQSLITREGILDYIYRTKKNENEDIRKSLTVQNLLNDQATLAQQFGFVSESVTLADAQIEMNKKLDRRVVFVTSSGSAKEPVIGMVSSTDIARKLQT